ncbi:hypothetical protein [Collimonas pratensis]|uniref:Uncharacterized protein n=1 Tax=Collimonas pratensis TaxID=279113 RepID=A0ABN4MF53_9BURK|nr:hypothetical protein [Collimonas pratensis]AMP16421.1 hypothetical protein CPter291_4191 [Collimonas pratensis]
MHFELPEKVASSVKEFASHYVMIVVSILTALALEQVVVTIHHKTSASIASANIRAELRENWKNVANLRKTHAENEVKLQAIVDALTDHMSKGGSIDTEQLNKLAQEATPLSIDTALNRTSAWDTAIANQALAYMNQADLNRYSAAYAGMRHVESFAPALVTDKLLRDAADLRLAVNTGKVDLQEVARILSRRLITMQIIGNQLKDLDAALIEFGGDVTTP